MATTKVILIDDSDDNRAVVPLLREIRDGIKSLGSASAGPAGSKGGDAVGSVMSAAKLLGGKGGSGDVAKLIAQFAGGGGGGQIGALVGRLGGGQAAGLARMFAGMGGGAAGGAAGAGAGAAAGGAGALGGLAAAAGPVGVMFAAAHLAAEGVSAKFRAVGEAAKFVGTEMRAMASNDHMGMFKAASDKAVSGLEKIGEYAPAWKVAAEGLKTATTVVNEFAATVDAFVKRGQELSKYNGELAAAGAKARNAEVLADVEESRRLGPALARLTDAQSRSELAFREALAPFKEILVDLLASVTEVAADFIGVVKPGVKFIADLLKAIIEILKKMNPLGPVEDGIAAIRKRFEGEQPQTSGQLNPLIEQLLQVDTGGGSSNAATAKANEQSFTQTASMPLFG
jgi:hypothetical protein